MPVAPATRNWIIRKYQSGMTADEIAAEFDGDPDIVQQVLQEEGHVPADGRSDQQFFSAYTESLQAIYGIDEQYFHRLPQLDLRTAIGFGTANAVLGVALIYLIFLGGASWMMGEFLPIQEVSTITAVLVVGPLLWTLWLGVVAHGLVVLLGGEDWQTTLKIYLVLSGFLLVLWFPPINLFVLMYGAVATVRALEEGQDLTFPRALLVTVVTPIIATAVPFIAATAV
ncbi:MAG: hypothetical protein ABEK12_01575 [Candidatus Nanohaloarchaea archaeon]